MEVQLAWIKRTPSYLFKKKRELFDEVVGLCYDTTASNSGAHQGACKLIENEIGRPLLWLPCRHHVSELHVKHAAKAVTGETKSPNDLLFQRFKESFPTISKENIKLWQWPKDKDSFLARQANEVRNWTKIAIEQDTFPREDYQELCQLIALFFRDRTLKSLPDQKAWSCSSCPIHGKINLLYKNFHIVIELQNVPS